MFIQQDSRSYQSEQRIEINIVGSAYRSQIFQYDIPKCKTNQGSNHTQKQKIQQNGRMNEQRKVSLPRLKHKDGKRSQYAIEKDLASNKNSIIPTHHLLHYQTIERP